MNRRELTRFLGFGLLASALAPRIAAAVESPQVAITMDDFNLTGVDEPTAEKRNRAILSALRDHSVKAAIFVCGKNVDSPFAQRMLRQWNDAGHIIGNHTYSHRYYAREPFEDYFADYTADILRCEASLSSYGQFRRLFRFPFLKEGATAEHRDRMRAFLAGKKYKNGAVTIDASDWYIDDRLRKRLDADPGADASGYRDYYLRHIADRSNYYDDVSRRALGRSVKHTLLVHHNELNGLYLAELLDQYRRMGWKLIDAEDAFTDPVFDRNPDVLPAGDSLVLAIGIESKKVERPRSPAEDGKYEAAAMDLLDL